MIRKTLLALVTAAAVLSASYAAGTAVKEVKNVNEEPTQVMSYESVIGTLPCFGCHDIKAYLDEDTPGDFSHNNHKGLGKHCNQCHPVKGHEMPRVEISTCTMCHSLEIGYEGGGMGKVLFSHELHAPAFACGKCHNSDFKMKRTATMQMEPMYSGKLCGACHDGNSAFSAMQCMKCHKQ